MTRYARQLCLPNVGNSGQEAIHAAHVLVIGVGGLGAPVLQYLVGAGVGRLTLVDDDKVVLSNLHRQTLFREASVGKSKASTAAETLRGLNKDCVIETIEAALDPSNAQVLVRKSTLVLDCADNFAVSYILSDTCKIAGIPLISASALGFAGYVGGFCGTAPSLRAVFPDLPDRAASCLTAGVMGPIVGMIGAAQAQMALGYLIGQSPSPLGQLISFDIETFRIGGFRFDTATEAKLDLNFISVADITSSDFVVELRDTNETLYAVTTNAWRFSVARFASQEPIPLPGQRAVFACRSGLRAWQAATHLRSYWDGEISLIAMGDLQSNHRKT